MFCHHDFTFLVTRMKKIHDLFYIMLSLNFTVIKRKEHTPYVWFLQLFIVKFTIWICNRFMMVAKHDFNNSFSISLESTLFNKLLFSKVKFIFVQLSNCLLGFSIYLWDKVFVKLLSTYRTCVL